MNYYNSIEYSQTKINTIMLITSWIQSSTDLTAVSYESKFWLTDRFDDRLKIPLINSDK